MQNRNCDKVLRCHLLASLSFILCYSCMCLERILVTLSLWSCGITCPCPSFSPLHFLCSIIQFSCVCGTQWIPTLHCSCAVRPNQTPDLYWFSATCARRLAAARTPHSLSALPSFPAPSLPLTPRATDAQCAAQSICHQLSAFSRAMKCGKMREGGEGV